MFAPSNTKLEVTPDQQQEPQMTSSTTVYKQEPFQIQQPRDLDVEEKAEEPIFTSPTQYVDQEQTRRLDQALQIQQSNTDVVVQALQVQETNVQKSESCRAATWRQQ
jgi:hypothetical protein